MSHYLSALACLTRAPLPFPPTILSPTPQSGDVSISIPGVSAAHPTNIGSGEGLLAYLYATLCLRISHFALFMFAAGGWGSIAVSSLISYSLPRSFPAPVENKDDVAAARRRRIVLGQLALSSQLSRSTILGHAEAALAPFRLAMTKAEQLAVHVEVVWLARWLEMERKEARVTREIIKLVSSVVVEGREEHTRWMSRVNSGLGLGVPIGRSDPQVMSHSVAFRRKEVTEGNAGVMDLIQRVCAALGVEILPLGVDAVTVPGIQGSNELNEPRFGWADLQVETLKEAIAVAENLPGELLRLFASADTTQTTQVLSDSASLRFTRCTPTLAPPTRATWQSSIPRRCPPFAAVPSSLTVSHGGSRDAWCSASRSQAFLLTGCLLSMRRMRSARRHRDVKTHSFTTLASSRPRQARLFWSRTNRSTCLLHSRTCSPLTSTFRTCPF